MRTSFSSKFRAFFDRGLRWRSRAVRLTGVFLLHFIDSWRWHLERLVPVKGRPATSDRHSMLLEMSSEVSLSQVHGRSYTTWISPDAEIACSLLGTRTDSDGPIRLIVLELACGACAQNSAGHHAEQRTFAEVCRGSLQVYS